MDGVADVVAGGTISSPAGANVVAASVADAHDLQNVYVQSYRSNQRGKKEVLLRNLYIYLYGVVSTEVVPKS